MWRINWSLLHASSWLLQLAFAQYPINRTLNELYDGIQKDIETTINLNLPHFSEDIAPSPQESINNVVLYWGQGDNGEQRLSYYCDQPGVTMMIIGFVVDFTSGKGKSPVLNLSDNCNNVENCVETAHDIKYCQDKGIKILISVGGAIGPYHKQSWDPDLFAWWMWNKFLGGTDRTVMRPFGDAILDGIDYDPESVDGAGYDRHIDTLRQLFKTDYPPREYLITAAPQCPDLDYYPKNAVYNILHPSPKYDSYPDMVFVQFYNNYCSASNFQPRELTNFNFDEWDKWAQKETNGRTRVFLGVLGKENHQDTGFVSYEKLTVILDEIRQHKSFGGVMMWDAGYAYTNKVPYLKGITYGEATTKYLDQLSTGSAKTAAAFDSINLAFKAHAVPILVPMVKNNTEPLESLIPCNGLSFLLLRSVSGRVLAENFGVSPDSVDEHLESLGMDADDFINPGSRICLTPKNGVIRIGYVFNATFDDAQNIAGYYHKLSY